MEKGNKAPCAWMEWELCSGQHVYGWNESFVQRGNRSGNLPKGFGIEKGNKAACIWMEWELCSGGNQSGEHEGHFSFRKENDQSWFWQVKRKMMSVKRKEARRYRRRGIFSIGEEGVYWCIPFGRVIGSTGRRDTVHTLLGKRGDSRLQKTREREGEKKGERRKGEDTFLDCGGRKEERTEEECRT